MKPFLDKGSEDVFFVHFLRIFIGLAGIFCLYGYWTNRQLQFTQENLTIKDLPHTMEGEHVIHLSDIHNGRLRVNKRKILKQIRLKHPALILITGDTIDRTDDVSQSNLATFINDLTRIAPTYLIEGNHERTSGQYQAWRQLILKTNAVILENQATIAHINHEPVTIIGLKNEETDLPQKEWDKLSLFPSIRLLLAHHPEKFLAYTKSFQSYPLTAIFSGHAHGGQVRLPFIDGLYSPDQGFLPKLVNGKYIDKSSGTTLFVSRGLSNSKFPFRIHNKPHIIDIELTST